MVIVVQALSVPNRPEKSFSSQISSLISNMVSATANVLATIGTVCWCVQLIPQIYHNYRRKNTEGFPEVMVIFWCLCAPFFAVFVVVEDASIPIMLQPHLFGFFCTVVYVQVMYYPPISRPKKQIILRTGLFVLFQICLEVGCIIPLRKVYQRGTTWPTLIFGIIASILIAFGLIPPYFELWKRDGRVVGINFLFLLVDLSGAVFSLASLAVDPADLDTMGLVLYTICATLEVGIFISQFVWLVRFRLFKKTKTNDLEQISRSATIENDVEFLGKDDKDESNDTDSCFSNNESASELAAEITRNGADESPAKQEKLKGTEQYLPLEQDLPDLSPYQTLAD